LGVQGAEAPWAFFANELDRDTYQPGPYSCFEVLEPKRIRISAAPFSNRVLHHALTPVIESVFERRFTANSRAAPSALVS
jgi:hypothetical protein